jgi:SAM-dependent methyltransferase
MEDLIRDDGLRLQILQELGQPPALWERGETLFWDDPYISQQMLAAHLDPHTDAASRRPETIARSVEWLIAALPLAAGQRVLDLGCGPGLYATQLARRGLRVTGVDYSRNSIAYARGQAQSDGLEIEYVCQNYLELDCREQYEAALLIYGDFCVLADAERDRLLGNVWRALKPGGQFVFDVSTRRLHGRVRERSGWRASAHGFWRPGWHLVLTQSFDYPEHDICVDQYVVIEANGRVSVYRNWFHDYAPETITPVLEAAGFKIRGIWGDLTGAPYVADAEWIGLVAEKGGKG